MLPATRTVARRALRPPAPPRRVPQLHITRLYSQYNYHHQYQAPNQPRHSWLPRILASLVVLSAIGGYSFYMFWPHHTFPSSVAKILRKGLWAESDKGENDYQLALKHYLEALDECNNVGVDKLSDEYTGIQLKVGEMFERLNMLQDAAFVYNEIGTLYLTVLTAPADSPQHKRIRDRDHRRHLIQKDLRIAIKLVELNRNDPNLSKAILLTHLIIAQDEVNRQLKANGSPAGATPPNDYRATVENDSIVLTNNGVTTTIKKTPEVWEPFADEFFNAMDLLGAICIQIGDLAMASRVKISMTEAMLLADAEPHKILMSQCNLGSLLYLQADEFEAQEVALRRKFAESAGLQYEQVKTEDLLGQNKQAQEVLEQGVSDEEKILYANTISSKNKCIQLATKSFESVLDFARGLPVDVANSNGNINQTVALATYGLGVVHLHLAEYEKAERLLRESRVRSKSCGYDELIGEIERELGKLFKEKKNLKEGKEGKDKGPIQMDIHLKK
ncbi:uncharacterized protein CANTADRAFT_50751 [Suhomyces tanzawaensis NRRL Y-17324]|uniref:TPR-like protein n=1 Tax=Suhomyces tanzawaensis NRRL Y-17324 TaxID=984487 RepID=A0A1E4SKA9_9ASCO|nr:uncharacterized protein CANTADRAFT_50751 [Suhomyces tanzawaensis NRRL Y-17324]ODV79941.1 hypothetical protein CANTADRAFT_50751 [Suhomyces tanzawaensis NRRL Y-17324]